MKKHNRSIYLKLADDNFICRKVYSKKTFTVFNKVEAALGDVTNHIEQIEKGARIWEAVFVPLMKAKSKEETLRQIHGFAGVQCYVSPSTGLIALIENRYQFFVFGKSTIACMHRIADLYSYDYDCETAYNVKKASTALTSHPVAAVLAFLYSSVTRLPGLQPINLKISMESGGNVPFLSLPAFSCPQNVSC